MVEITRWHELTERIWQAIAWRLPRQLVYWAILRAWTYGTNGDWMPEFDEETVPELIDRWNDEPKAIIIRQE